MVYNALYNLFYTYYKHLGNQGIKEKFLEKRITTSLLYPTIRDGSKAMYSVGSDITPWFGNADRQYRKEGVSLDGTH